jgi:hypothetical protein
MPKPVAGGQEIGGSTASAAEPMTEASHKPALVLDADQTMPGPSFARPAVRAGLSKWLRRAWAKCRSPEADGRESAGGGVVGRRAFGGGTPLAGVVGRVTYGVPEQGERGGDPAPSGGQPGLA